MRHGALRTAILKSTRVTGRISSHWELQESTRLLSTFVSIEICEFYCTMLVTTTKSLLTFATICIVVNGSGLSGKKAGGYLKQAQNSSALNSPSQASALVIHSLFQRKGSAYLILAIDMRRGKELTLDPHTANNLPAGARCKELSRPRTSRQYRGPLPPHLYFR
jgi:hypothetical protein